MPLLHLPVGASPLGRQAGVYAPARMACAAALAVVAVTTGIAAMLLAHAVAAGVSAGWLRWGERLVWAGARRTAGAAVAAVATLRLGLVRGTWMTPSRPRQERLRHLVVLRAPPAAA